MFRLSNTHYIEKLVDDDKIFLPIISPLYILIFLICSSSGQNVEKFDFTDFLCSSDFVVKVITDISVVLIIVYG